LHLSFRLILCQSTSILKLRPHIFTGSVLCPMRKRDHHAPALFLPQLCCFSPTKLKRTTSDCSRLCVRPSHRVDSSEEWRVPAERTAGARQPAVARTTFRRRDVCRLQQRAAASAVCHCPCWPGMGPQLVLHSTMEEQSPDVVK
jgi:hypothetical protein